MKSLIKSKNIQKKPESPVTQDLPPLDQSLLLEEGQPPRRSRMSIFGIVSVLGIFILWAAITPVDEVAVGEGEIIPNGFVKSIQHLEGGIVRQVYVQDGDFVEPDQVLISLQSEAALSDLEQMKVREAALRLKAERFRALGTGEAPHFEQFDKSIPEDIIKEQQSIYDIKLKDYENQRHVIERQVEQQVALINVQMGEKHDLAERIAVLEEQRDVVKGLLKKQLQTRTNLYLVEDRLGEVRQFYHQKDNEIHQTQEAIGEAKDRLIQLSSRSRNEAMDDMGKATAELLEVNEMRSKQQDRVRRLDIKSPSRGIVKGLKATTLKGIIPPGGEIMQIVPVENMEIEAKISPKDVGNVHPGQAVVTKITAFDYARYGVIKGVLKSVSATSFIDEVKKEPYFKVYVALDKFYVGNNSEVNRITPGMTALVEIRIGAKRLLDYIVKPIYNVYTQAFRER